MARKARAEGTDSSSETTTKTKRPRKALADVVAKWPLHKLIIKRNAAREAFTVIQAQITVIKNAIDEDSLPGMPS